jgi:putative phage-type endonuclease
MNHLKRLELPEQRSKEWYEIRETLLTASSLADALGKGHFKTRDALLLDKTSVSDKKDTISKMSRDIMQWGVKYEPVATEFYEHLYGVKIIEFGLIPHPELSVFGASPDGICDIGSPNGYTGRMLEIKCPPKRKFTHEVPLHYWMQMQGQLEVCDLDECDFFQVKLEEYSSVGEYEKDQLCTDRLLHGKTSNDLPKGLLIAYMKKKSDTIEYKYSPWLAPLDEIITWRDQTLQELCDEYTIYEMRWWRIERYECTLVRRDKSWWLSIVPDIIQFWKDVVHYREVGNEEIQKKIDGRKRGPRKKVFEISEPLKGYLMDSDED